jgi:hypothetical protein
MLGEGNDVGMPYFLEDVFDMGSENNGVAGRSREMYTG